LAYSLALPSVSPKANLAVAVAIAVAGSPILYTTIGQSILPETAFQAEIDVDTPTFMWLPN
jgi:hypothetical protein